jgi:hypothetical protein
MTSRQGCTKQSDDDDGGGDDDAFFTGHRKALNCLS